MVPQECAKRARPAKEKRCNKKKIFGIGSRKMSVEGIVHKAGLGYMKFLELGKRFGDNCVALFLLSLELQPWRPIQEKLVCEFMREAEVV